ncbi:hypothetical protein [Pontibacter sp. H249]|uniref:hypothetical protein n=1 Tax=Pontibacter sp. H249 TaxID=3133420 RepID=UPI0030C250A9
MISDFFAYDIATSTLKYTSEGSAYSIHVQNLVAAQFYPEYSLIITTTQDGEKEELRGYSTSGEMIFKQPAPEHYKFWYLGNDLRIAFTEKDEFAEKSGRSGWWFKINPLDGGLEKDCWAY